MATTTTVTASIQWTPPSAAVNSGVASFTVAASCNAQNVGQIDVQVSDTSGTLFPIPFGSVSGAKVMVIKNMMSSDIGVRINGSVADNFRIATGGELIYSCAAVPGASPITSVTVVTTAAPTVIENISYWVMGD